jgi:nitroimidazol reductase NimA-like FMN-containing flavoprotein (pyridoxamine 5'-phosphate oxidase superfamily)
MTERTPVAEKPLIDDAKATAWEKASSRLGTPERERTYWLATVRPDGRPHVMPILGLWLDDAFYFITGAETRKGKNLAANAECVLTASSHVLPSLDVVVEGRATRVTDEGELRRVVAAFGSELEWELTLRDGAVEGQNAPTARPPPYAVFGLRPTTVFGLPGTFGMEKAKDPFTPTRWRF